MVDSTIQAELLKQLDTLPVSSQLDVLNFAKSLRTSLPKAAPLPKGTPGKDLLHFAGTISPEDCRLMEQAIEEECERIDPDEW